ncbi:trypsin-like serine peptidase [Stackebrandtia soli]|uniref:trypsin-like serine peptidase n=1 Tax=Stackebrandtia soli TaxID=1892856 RepID=UPI0039E7F528
MRRSLMASLLAGSLITTALLTSPASAAPTTDTEPSVETAHNTATTAELDAFWTPERIRDAVPLDAPPAGPRLGSPAPPSTADADEILVPGSAPTGDVGTTGIVETTGRLFFSSNGGTYVCTATVIAGNNKSMLATARHCGFGSGGTNYRFAPSFNNNNAPHGWWDWRSAGWVNGGDGIEYDFAFVVLNTQNGRYVTDVVGSGGLAFNAGHGHYMRVVGIPASTNNVTSCEGQAHTGPSNQYLLNNCNGLSGGASGGSWLINWNGNNGGYQVGTYFGSYGSAAAGSYFGDAAHGVWNGAQNS